MRGARIAGAAAEGCAKTRIISEVRPARPQRARGAGRACVACKGPGARPALGAIALGLLLGALATTTLAQSDSRDVAADLRSSLDADAADAPAAPPDRGLAPAVPASGSWPTPERRAAGRSASSLAGAISVEPAPPSGSGTLAPAPGVAIGPPPPVAPKVPPRPKGIVDDDPFDAVGMRVGAFLLRPAIEVFSGFDSNPARVPAGRGSALIIVAPELQLRSDWVRHELNATIRGSYNDDPAVALADRPALDARVDGRIDVTRDGHIDLEGRSVIGTDYPGSPNLGADVARLPIFDTVGGTLGLSQRFEALDVTLKGMIDRTTWQDSRLTNGASSSNQDRNFDQVGGEMRAAYTVPPVLKPFVALDFDTRIHDLALDRSGLLRDSEGWTPRAGVSLDLAQPLSGEFAVGYLLRTYKDPTLPDVRGSSVDGSLLYILTPLTSVRLTAKSSIDESVLAGVSGVLRRDGEIGLDHALRRWLIATIRFGYGLDDYVGSSREDRRYQTSVALTYKLSRALQLKGELREIWLCSSEPGQNYRAIVAMMGVRYQR